MFRKQAGAAAALAVAMLLSACHHTQPVAAAPTPAPAPNADSAARADSIARADAARRDSIARAQAYADSVAAAQSRMAQARATLEQRIHFDFDKSDLRAEDKAILDAKLPILRANPALRIRIDGNCDDRGSETYNLALGQRRAAAAKRYLTDYGIAADRIDIISYGEERPIAQGQDEAAWSQNRRDDFEIVSGGDNIVSAQ